MKQQLDQLLLQSGLVSSRSQANKYIKLGKVYVDGHNVIQPNLVIDHNSKIELRIDEQYVSRAGLKLASVAGLLKLDFKHKIVLDVGSSTGGFTDYSLKHGANKVIAVDVGNKQLHPSLHNNPKIELHENTDIREIDKLSVTPDVVLIDVSFISLRDILPYVSKLSGSNTQIIAMVKPQFETKVNGMKHGGVIKNERVRRDLLKEFESWAKQYFVLLDKSDSAIAGVRGNLERFYSLRKL